MTPRTTRTLLFAVPLSIWLLLLGMTAGLSADGRPPSGGMFTIVVGLAITSSAVAIAVWARGDAKAHVSAELQEVKVNLSHDLAMFFQMMSRRLDSLDGPTQPLLRVVGTAAVATAMAAPDDELPGYAKGFADGLARRPMEAKVIPIDGHHRN